jgi:streptomycin 6-kinase
MAARDADWAAWVDRLPGLAQGLLDEWELTVDGLLMHGYCSLVVPVLTAGGERAVLKITCEVDDESEFEHLALRRWDGHGTVRLLRADPHRRALLLERLRHENLDGLWDIEACEVVAGLYQQIHVPALPQLRTLTSYVEQWRTGLTELPRNAPVPRRLVEQAISLAGDLVADPDSAGTLIHGDLHYQNVLGNPDSSSVERSRDARGAWLVIDPKPMDGDPHYELAPMLWNRFDELAGDVRTGVRRRFHTLVDAAGLDEHRARDWVVVRMLCNANWTVEDARFPERSLTSEEADWITMCVAVAKAVQD